MIKLKHLVENATEQAYAPLTREEKKKLYETVKAYNEYRDNLKFSNVYQAVSKINEAIHLAERYALKECGDWMEAKMVERDIKEIKRHASEMMKEAEKLKSVEKTLEMLYEEAGIKLEKYFEIAEKLNPASDPSLEQNQ